MKKMFGLLMMILCIALLASCQKDTFIIHLQNSDGTKSKVKVCVTDDIQVVDQTMRYLSLQSAKQSELSGFKIDCDMNAFIFGYDMDLDITMDYDMILSKKNGLEAKLSTKVQSDALVEQEYYDVRYFGSLESYPDENSYIYTSCTTSDTQSFQKYNTQAVIAYLYSKLKEESNNLPNDNLFFPHLSQIDSVESFIELFPNSTIAITNLKDPFIQFSYRISWKDILTNLIGDDEINQSWENDVLFLSYLKEIEPLIFSTVFDLNTGLLQLFECHYDASKLLKIFSTAMNPYSKAAFDITIQLEYGDFTISNLVPNVEYEDRTQYLA